MENRKRTRFPTAPWTPETAPASTAPTSPLFFQFNPRTDVTRVAKSGGRSPLWHRPRGQREQSHGFWRHSASAGPYALRSGCPKPFRQFFERSFVLCLQGTRRSCHRVLQKSSRAHWIRRRPFSHYQHECDHRVGFRVPRRRRLLEQPERRRGLPLDILIPEDRGVKSRLCASAFGAVLKQPNRPTSTFLVVRYREKVA